MDERDPNQTTNRRAAWLTTFILGVVIGIAALELGVIGMALIVLAFALIAWKGPQVTGAAGFICGFAGIWTLLLGNVVVRCDLAQLPESSCGSGITGAYLGGAIVLLLVGVAMTLVGVRRGRKRAG